MKFLCNHCKAKYQIADEKVLARTLRMTCRQCGKEIIIQGPRSSGAPDTRSARPKRSASSQSVPLPPSVLASDFRKQMGAAPSRERQWSAAATAQWHVAISDIPVGPMRLEEVSRKITTGAVGAQSLVWREGLDDWMPAAQVPEIAALLNVPPASGSLFPAHHAGSQTSESTRSAMPRASAIPIGGRLGSDVPMSSEDFFPSTIAPDTHIDGQSLSQVGRLPESIPARNLFQSWGVMFVMVCGGAFIMMIGVVLGVKYLGSTERLERVTTTVEKTTPATAVSKDESAGIIVLETQEIDGQLTGTKKQKASAKAGTSQAADNKGAIAKNGKGLSAQEKDLLVRMGGGLDRGPSDLRTTTTSTTSTGSAASGGLKASQLNAVVSRGKMELQRCYEAALRMSPSDQTIRLDVDITVGLSGTVTSVKTRGPALGDMSSCISRTVRMWRFPNAGEETRTTFPVVFQPGA
jgi:hypothetical protein